MRLISQWDPRLLGCPLFCCFGWFLSVCFRWLSSFAWLCAFVGSCLFCDLSVSPFALGLSVVLLVAVSPLPLGCSRVASWPNQASAVLVPPSGYLVASCDRLVALPVAWSVVVLCYVAPWQQRPLALCGVTGLPSTPWDICCCELCAPSLRRLQLFSAANMFFFCLTAFSASNTRFFTSCIFSASWLIFFTSSFFHVSNQNLKIVCERTNQKYVCKM